MPLAFAMCSRHLRNDQSPPPYRPWAPPLLVLQIERINWSWLEHFQIKSTRFYISPPYKVFTKRKSAIDPFKNTSTRSKRNNLYQQCRFYDEKSCWSSMWKWSQAYTKRISNHVSKISTFESLEQKKLIKFY